jgi:hypothetical protein
LTLESSGEYRRRDNCPASQGVQPYANSPPRPWGADIRSLCGRGEFVLVDHTAEEIVAVHGTGVGRRISSGDRSVDPVRRLQVEGAVRPLAVVVGDVDAKDMLKLAATED